VRLRKSNPHRGETKLLNRIGLKFHVESKCAQILRHRINKFPVGVSNDVSVDSQGDSRIGVTELDIKPLAPALLRREAYSRAGVGPHGSSEKTSTSSHRPTFHSMVFALGQESAPGPMATTK
jgi:hypothetical protein